ncbi:oxidoreductase [Ramlibacter sp. AW1]|uniref:Oxidoreductase n=1 Tax=Ramlibacter aurantiacus TaxID=2801330 RepID=A0A936ZUJ8_9BURK|nr:oxidoreductase [Ramlibacter aurantiacus]
MRIRGIRQVATDVNSYELVPADGRLLPAFTAGAHIDVQVPNGMVRQYSLHGNPADRSAWHIAVKREMAGRGGSASLHDFAEVGSALGIVGPRNHFPLAAGAKRHLFIAGGIGITPLYAMAQALSARDERWDLHYCARTPDHAAFYNELQSLRGGSVTPHFSEVPTLDVTTLLHEEPEGTHLYCCGPAGLMKAVETASRHWAPGTVHFEWFAAPVTDHPANQPVEVELARSSIILLVPAERSILQVVRENGIYVECACEEGVCGTCETAVLDGEPQHRDMLLSPEERAGNRTMMICVSRANSKRLVLDL